MSTAAILGDVAGRSLTRDSAVGARREPALGGVAGYGRRPARVDLAQVATQLAQLVAQLRGVLEAQVVGRRDHLLLELDDHLLELVLRHLLAFAALGRTAFATFARHLRLGLEEVADVRD